MAIDNLGGLQSWFWTKHLCLTGAFYVGNGWVAGGCWDDHWVMTGIIPENSLRLAPVSCFGTKSQQMVYTCINYYKLRRLLAQIVFGFSKKGAIPQYPTVVLWIGWEPKGLGKFPQNFRTQLVPLVKCWCKQIAAASRYLSSPNSPTKMIKVHKRTKTMK